MLGFRRPRRYQYEQTQKRALEPRWRLYVTPFTHCIFRKLLKVLRNAPIPQRHCELQQSLPRGMRYNYSAAYLLTSILRALALIKGKKSRLLLFYITVQMKIKRET